MQVDLVGGYYDAGDNVQFGFPMAFTTTMLSWSVIEFGGLMKSELQNAKEAIRWATDYLLKATVHPDTIYVQVYVFPSVFVCVIDLIEFQMFKRFYYEVKFLLQRMYILPSSDRVFEWNVRSNIRFWFQQVLDVNVCKLVAVGR